MRNHLHTAPILLGTHAEELSLLCPETSSGGGRNPFFLAVAPTSATRKIVEFHHPHRGQKSSVRFFCTLKSIKL